MSGRAKNAQIYPEDLCMAILKGLKEQLTADKRLRPHEQLLQVCTEEEVKTVFLVDDGIEYCDDVSGKMLEKNLVENARAEEMQVFKEHEVYTKVPVEEAMEQTGKIPSESAGWTLTKATK